MSPADSSSDVLSSSESAASSSAPETSDEPTRTDESGNEEIVIPEGAIEAQLALKDTSITMYLPSKWMAEGAQILEDGRLVAEVYTITTTTDRQGLLDTMEKELGSPERRDFTAPGMEGRFYLLSTEVNRDGVTFKENELLYHICMEDKLLEISFYPAFGIGIGTQREEFEEYLKTLSL